MEPILIYPVLFIAGAVLGTVANWFADRYCWTPRYRSPWRIWPTDFIDKLNNIQVETKRRRKTGNKTTPSIEQGEEFFTKRWIDFVPIIGSFSIRRIGARLEQLPEAERLPGLENRWFWLRPFLVELSAALGVCWLFWWEVEHQMLRPDGVASEPWETVAIRCGVHVVFFAFLLAASLIDIDDMIIPDNLTVTGTLFALLLAAFLPQTQLPSMVMNAEIVMPTVTADRNPVQQIDFRYTVEPKAEPLHLCSPNSSEKLAAAILKTDSVKYFGIMYGLWLFWCFAMLPRVWYFQLPFKKAAAIFCRYLKRMPTTKLYASAALLGPLVIIIPMTVFSFAGSFDPWKNPPVDFVSLLSALVGMTVGMLIIWATRIIGGGVLGREAMGFGDVTLMGMIGAFVGWQASIMIFFLAPIAGILLWGFNAAVGRGREFPYGPYLCLATFLVIVGWGGVWTIAGPYYFELGWWIGVIMTVCLIMLGVLLGLWRWIRERLLGIH